MKEIKDMQIDSILSFVALVTLLVMSPGPNSALILKTVPLHGRKNGFINIFGFLTAISIHGIFSVLGLSAILIGSSKAFLIVKILGAIYLIYIGLKSLYHAFRHNIQPILRKSTKKKDKRKKLLSAYTEGFLTNLLNPKLSIFYLAAFPQFVDFSAGAWSSASFLILLHLSINFLWFSSLVIFVGKIANKVRSSYLGRLVQGVTGMILIWFGYRLASTRSTI